MIEKLEMFLAMGRMLRILFISRNNTCDNRIWMLTKDVQASTKSTYELIMKENQNNSSALPNWRPFWKTHISQKILFIWL